MLGFFIPFIMWLLNGNCRIVSRTVTLHINLSLVDWSCLYSFVCLFRFVFFKHYFQARGRLKKQNLEKKKFFSETILYKLYSVIQLFVVSSIVARFERFFRKVPYFVDIKLMTIILNSNHNVFNDTLRLKTTKH